MSLSELKAKIERSDNIGWELEIGSQKSLVHEIDEKAYFQSFFVSRLTLFNYKNFSSANVNFQRFSTPYPEVA